MSESSRVLKIEELKLVKYKIFAQKHVEFTCETNAGDHHFYRGIGATDRQRKEIDDLMPQICTEMGLDLDFWTEDARVESFQSRENGEFDIIWKIAICKISQDGTHYHKISLPPKSKYFFDDDLQCAIEAFISGVENYLFSSFYRAQSLEAPDFKDLPLLARLSPQVARLELVRDESPATDAN